MRFASILGALSNIDTISVFPISTARWKADLSNQIYYNFIRFQWITSLKSMNDEILWINRGENYIKQFKSEIQLILSISETL